MHEQRSRTFTLDGTGLGLAHPEFLRFATESFRMIKNRGARERTRIPP